MPDICANALVTLLSLPTLKTQKLSSQFSLKLIILQPLNKGFLLEQILPPQVEEDG